MRWHVRHVCTIWVFARVLGTMILAWAGYLPDNPLQPSLVSVLIALALTTLDRQRTGATLLFANLGYSRWWLLRTSGVVIVIAELLLCAAARAIAGQVP